MLMATTVTENNLVSIPAEIAREFDIHPGTGLAWTKAGGRRAIWRGRLAVRGARPLDRLDGGATPARPCPASPTRRAPS